MDSIIGVLEPVIDIIGTIVTSQVRAANIMVELAATDGEQIINRTIAGVNPDPGPIVIISLPLRGAVTRGILSTFAAHLTAKTITTQATTIDLELLMDDSISISDPSLFVEGGGSNTLAQIIGFVPDATVGNPLTAEEEVGLRSFAARRAFITKGTAGALGLAIRINGGEDIDYDFLIQVLGTTFLAAT